MAMVHAELEDRIVGKASEDGEFRARMLADPRTAIRKVTGAAIPVHVHEESTTSFHIVLPPRRPAGGGGTGPGVRGR